VINADDEAATQMVAAAGGREVVTYGINAGDWRAVDVALKAGETQFELKSSAGNVMVQSHLTGRVNVYNLLAAMAAAVARGLTLEEAVESARHVKPVPGRFEAVPNDLGFTVVVDYAHTDDALQNLIGIARDLVGTGRVITMFGCGGDRDKTKRPKMGRVAGAGSDLVVVTSDNPRSEEPMEIIDEVMLGVREEGATFIVEEDRRAAIEVAIRAAKPGDIVLLAGKGHEKVQIFADGAMPFDDVEEAARVLRDLRSGVGK